MSEVNEVDEGFQELLDRLDPQTRTLVAEVDLGLQAREFANSDLGRHLVGCLHQEMALAQSALNETQFWMFWKIQRLQNQIWRSKFMLGWLRDLILSGKSADGVLKENEHGE